MKVKGNISISFDVEVDVSSGSTVGSLVAALKKKAAGKLSNESDDGELSNLPAWATTKINNLSIEGIV